MILWYYSLNLFFHTNYNKNRKLIIFNLYAIKFIAIAIAILLLYTYSTSTCPNDNDDERTHTADWCFCHKNSFIIGMRR